MSHILVHNFLFVRPIEVILNSKQPRTITNTFYESYKLRFCILDVSEIYTNLHIDCINIKFKITYT